MASAGDYAVAQERDGAFRLDRITEPFSGTAAFIKPVKDRSCHRSGWRLKPLVTMQGSLSKVWASPAEAIASTKLMTLSRAKIAVEGRSRPVLCGRGRCVVNHIVRLETDLAAAQAEIEAKANAIQEFRIHLAGSKFAGVDADGSRKDWIATSDVYAWLTHISAAGA